MAATAKRPEGESCGMCGHWSLATEYGLDDGSGYCDRWEKIKARTFWCEEFVSNKDFDKHQQALAEDNEEWIDDEY